MHIWLATGNVHKKKELDAILRNSIQKNTSEAKITDFELKIPKDAGLDFDPEETGSTFLENALIKAEELYKLLKDGSDYVIAEDSGICVDALNGRPGILSARYGGKSLGAAEKNAMLDEFYFNAAALKPGVVAFLEALKARGVKMCVATATDRYLIEASLSRVGIDKYFERIFTCNEERTSKSSPDIFIRAAKFLGTDVGETVVVEDASHAIRSAKSAGFKVMAVFDQSAAAHQEEIRAMSDYYYTSLDDLIY